MKDVRTLGGRGSGNSEHMWTGVGGGGWGGEPNVDVRLEKKL